MRGKVQSWSSDAYQDLLKTVQSVPAGDPRDQAFDRVRRLDCINSNPTLASFDPSLRPPSEVAAWQKSLEEASADDATYAKALTQALKPLLCSGSKDASLILRGFLAQPVGVLHVPILGATHLSNRLSAAGPEAPALVNFIMSKDCPVSASLTDTDRANLLQIKQFALAQPPPSAAK